MVFIKSFCPSQSVPKLLIIVLFFGQVHRQAGFGHTEAEVSKNIRKQATKVHTFNAHIAKDPRVELVILPLFDGLTLVRKRDPFDD
jgi:predicted O-methyltransferase YrrM